MMSPPASVNTDAESAASEAAAGVGNRRTVSDAERDSVFDRNNQDIDTDAAYALAGLNDTRAWNANVKRTYDTLDEELQSGVKQAQSQLADLHTIRVQMLTNMATNADNLQKQHLAHRDIATDRTWNVDEVSALVAKSGVQADAFVALLSKSIADALAAGK